jgi:carboxypeptidase Taq
LFLSPPFSPSKLSTDVNSTDKIQTSLNLDFVSQASKIDTIAHQKWKEVREKNDWKTFEPYLQKQVDLARQKAKLVSPEKPIYDTLLDLFEPEMTAIKYCEIFDDLKPFLIKNLPLILAKQENQNLKKIQLSNLDKNKQIEFSKFILEKMGFEFNRGVLTETAHPFSITLGTHDNRVSNRYNKDNIEFIFAAIHEGGHGLYNLGIKEEIWESLLEDGFSYGMHESQSRIWEVFAAKTDEFWESLYPELQSNFPEIFGSYSLNDWMNFIKYIEPNLIRINSDIITYPLHIIIRFEIEKELFEDKITVSDIPKVWNQKYENYLGIKVSSDTLGCLQDIHWSKGSFGYFPTYLYGTMISAQFWHFYTQHNPGWKTEFKTGNFLGFRNWLKENIHQHGKIYSTTEILNKTCGENLQTKYFKEYITENFL